MSEKFGSKKTLKRAAKTCIICGEDNYEVLDVHRLIHGSKYTYNGTVVICSKCHRLHHAHVIHIDKWFNSSKGRLLRWVDKEGKEHFS